MTIALSYWKSEDYRREIMKKMIMCGTTREKDTIISLVPSLWEDHHSNNHGMIRKTC